MTGPFYIVDVRHDWMRKPYVTVWRPENAGYAYPLSWAGKYDRATIDANPGYYHLPRYGSKRTLDRFPVPCEAVEALAIDPAPGIIDGNAGPVVPNLAPIRAALRKARYIPAQGIVTPAGDETQSGSVGEADRARSAVADAPNSPSHTHSRTES